MIYIDAGHGGKDGGAISNGVKESTINLAVSNYLAKEFEQQGFAYKCCRTDDATSKTLEERVKEANNWGAYIYLSIHCNASEKTAPNGTITYIYSYGGESEKIADKIQARLQPLNGVSEWERVEDDNFYVLRKTTMPAVLIELGFITNATDRAALTNTETQKQIAKDICKAICEYYGIEYKGGNTMAKDNTPDKYAKEAIEWAIKEGILYGNENGDYMLHSNITRQDMLVFLYRALKK